MVGEEIKGMMAESRQNTYWLGPGLALLLAGLVCSGLRPYDRKRYGDLDSSSLCAIAPSVADAATPKRQN